MRVNVDLADKETIYDELEIFPWHQKILEQRTNLMEQGKAHLINCKTAKQKIKI